MAMRQAARAADATHCLKRDVARKSGSIFASAAIVAITATVFLPAPSRADQGGISFWLPGAFGSLAAAPAKPGWSWANIYLHSAVSAGGNVAASRAIRFGNQTVNLNVNLNATLDAKVDIGLFGPSYVFATPVLGGQLAVNLLIPYGRQRADIDALLTGALGPIGFSTQRSVSQSLTDFGDILVQPTLKWNQGVHNYMVYGMWNFPVGSYDVSRLVNLGLGHWAIDGGAGYTYFNPQTGWEYSGVAGVTYNFVNPYLDYQNGVAFHFDGAISRFVAKNVLIGAVGYAYQQLTGDSGAGATLGDFKSRVFGIGPQIGFIFPVGEMQGYLNLKGFKEFDAQNRPEGWNFWVTLALSPADQPKPPASPPPRRGIALK